jgi:hypothetical protein
VGHSGKIAKPQIREFLAADVAQGQVRVCVVLWSVSWTVVCVCVPACVFLCGVCVCVPACVFLCFMSRTVVCVCAPVLYVKDSSVCVCSSILCKCYFFIFLFLCEGQ